MNPFTRRAVLMAGGALTVLGATFGRRAQAAPTPQPTAQPLLWLDASLPRTATRADTVLEPELVGQWRRQLCAQLRDQARPVTALVRWDKAMVLAGLAREEGFRTRTQRLGQGVFRVDVMV